MTREDKKNYQELFILLGKSKTVKEIDVCREEIAELIPKVRIMFEYDQQNTYHQYDLWEHCLQTVVGLPRGIEDDMLYLAALLHDIGKPACQCKGKREDDKNMNYYGHQKMSKIIVQDEVIPCLEAAGVNLPEEDKQRLLYYVEYHDLWMSYRENHLKRQLDIVPIEMFKRLMLLEIADAKAHVQMPIIKQRIEICEYWYKFCDNNKR